MRTSDPRFIDFMLGWAIRAGKFPPERRVQVIFDQMKPAYAKYYRREEAMQLVRSAGFENVRVHHRHGYSWTVLGTKPGASEHHPRA